MHKFYVCLANFVLLSACSRQPAAQNPSEPALTQAAEKLTETKLSEPKPTEPKPVNKLADGIFCFKKSLNQDVTNVQLIISGDHVNGFMNWIPYQKDSARGTFKGTQNQIGELDLIYDYMIEGNLQSEIKIMKIENEKLWFKKGELIDLKNDGHLVYKDVSQAKYEDGLEKADCKTLVE